MLQCTTSARTTVAVGPRRGGGVGQRPVILLRRRGRRRRGVGLDRGAEACCSVRPYVCATVARTTSPVGLDRGAEANCSGWPLCATAARTKARSSLSAAGGTLQRIPRLLLPLSDDAYTPPPPSLGPQRSAALNGGGDGSASQRRCLVWRAVQLDGAATSSLLSAPLHRLRTATRARTPFHFAYENENLCFITSYH